MESQGWIACKAMDKFMDTVVRFKCVDRESKVSVCRVQQAIYDRLYIEGLSSSQTNYTGSSYEGMADEVCGDMDGMLTMHVWPVVVCEPPSNAPAHGYLMADMNMDQPAFTRLQPCLGTNYDSYIKDAIVQAPSYAGVLKSYVKCKLFVTRAIAIAGMKMELHGPAGTGHDPRVGEFDGVFCLSSPSWPPCTSEFLTRPRTHDWPSQSMIEKIHQAGCHLVGVGHPSSDNKDIEWRWSFSMAEKELIHDLSDTMAGVMYALKAIKKKHFPEDDPDKPTTFCSYYIKTACLWVNERNWPVQHGHHGSLQTGDRLAGDMLQDARTPTLLHT